MRRRMSRGSFTRIALLSLSAMIIVATLVAGNMIKQNKKFTGDISDAPSGFGLSDLADNDAESQPQITEPELIGEQEKVETYEEAPQPSEAAQPEQVQTANVSEVIAAAAGTVDFSKLVWPVTSSEIVMDYSYNTKAVFSPTFNEYRSDHTGVDIAANLGESVKCVYDGKVVAISDDEKLGTSVKVDHGNNIFTEYANLEKNVAVTLNQVVKAGADIGKVGNTAKYESAQQPHLHFALILNGAYVDIKDYIGK